MMNQRVMKVSFAGLVAAALMFVGPAMAVDLPSSSVTVTAEVASSLSFNATICEIIPPAAPGGANTFASCGSSTPLAFGDWASHGTFTAPDGTQQPRALNSLRAYQVFFGVNSQQRSFIIKQTASPLVSGGDRIPDGAFIVTPLDGVGGDTTLPFASNPPGNTTVRGTQGTAVATDKVLFSSSGGPTNTMAATYGVTDDPNAGAFEFIPLDQPTGSYATTVTFTATVL